MGAFHCAVHVGQLHLEVVMIFVAIEDGYIRHPHEVPHQHGSDCNLSAEVHVDGGALDRRVREVLHRVSQPWVVDPRQAWL